MIFAHDRQLNFSRTVWITLPLPRHNFQCLGDILAEFDELAATVRTGRRCRHDDTLARQVSRQRRPHGSPARDVAHRCGVGLGRPSRNLVFRGARFQLLELQFQLVE